MARGAALVHRRVGMFGISWGGFNGLQVAARRPPELQAVISMCASDDRYADDVHYIGGCVLALDMLPWAATMLTLLAQPPDPATVGAGWRDTWFARMERTPAFVEPWLAHQRRDDYWRHGSVCEDYARIQAPVYAIGGWADGYSNAVPRLLAGLPGPRKGLVGPWSHAFPQDGEPGPAIGFLQECLRWWDHWLKDADTGIMDEPMLRAWVQDPVRPAGSHAERPGRWVAEERWPSPEIEVAEWTLAADGLRPPGAARETASRPRRRSSITARTPPGRTRAHGAPTAGRATSRSTSAPRTAARSTFTSPPLERARRDPGVPRGRRSRSPPTARGRSSRCGCATSRPTAPRCS